MEQQKLTPEQRRMAEEAKPARQAQEDSVARAIERWQQSTHLRQLAVDKTVEVFKGREVSLDYFEKVLRLLHKFMAEG